MKNQTNSNKKNLEYLKIILKRGDISYLSFLIPSIFAALSTIFEAVSIILLMPSLQGIISGSILEKLNPKLKNIVIDFLPGEIISKPNLLIIFFLTLVILFSIAKNFCYYFSVVNAEQLSLKFSATLRTVLFERFLSFGKLYFDRQKMGRVIHVIRGFSQEVAKFFSEAQFYFLQLLLLISYLALMLYISVQLTLIVVLTFPLLFIGFKTLLAKIKENSALLVEAKNNVGTKITNTFNCISLVKAYSAEVYEVNDFSKIVSKHESLSKQISILRHVVNPLQESIGLIALLVIVSFIYLSNIQIDIALLGVYLLIVRRMTSVIGSFNKLRTDLATVSGALSEIAEVMSNEKKFFVAEGNKKFDGLTNSIAFNSVDFAFSERKEIFSRLNISFPKNKITALVGQSGAGKSTIINLLMRFYEPSQGTITADGIDIKKFDLRSWRNQFALVEQEAQLFDDTLRKNITYGNDNTSEIELTEVLEKTRLTQLIKKLKKGLDTEIGHRGVRLSEGEKQRISIARAFLKKSSIIILDEPTSALDSQTEAEIQDSLNQLWVNKTVIVIAHRLSTIKNADQIIVLENGKVIEVGKLEELLEKSKVSTDIGKNKGLFER